MQLGKLIKYGLIGAAAVVIAALFLRSCSLYDQNSVLKGKYEAYRAIAKADHEMLAKEINTLTSDNVKKDGEISKLKAEKIVINTALAGKDKDLAELRKSWSKLSVECQAALHVLDTKWEEKAVLYEAAIKNEQDTTAQWVGKYNNAVKIGDDWKKDYENEHTLRLLAEKRIGGLEGSLRWSKFWKTGTTILAVVGVGYIGVDLIRGK